MTKRLRVGILIPNLFLRVPVEAAVRGAGGWSLSLARLDQPEVADCGMLLLDLDSVRPDPVIAVRGLVTAGKVVLGFSRETSAQVVAAVRAAGGVVLPRASFLSRLPELLSGAVAAAEKES